MNKLKQQDCFTNGYSSTRYALCSRSTELRMCLTEIAWLRHEVNGGSVI